MGFQSGGGKYDNRPREMHKAVCADCNKECDVPFKPSGDRPVYCKDCFSKRKDGGR
jgi:CxxC-x17-CxxC domain-containing protein